MFLYASETALDMSTIEPFVYVANYSELRDGPLIKKSDVVGVGWRGRGGGRMEG